MKKTRRFQSLFLGFKGLLEAVVVIFETLVVVLETLYLFFQESNHFIFPILFAAGFCEIAVSLWVLL